MTEFKDINPNQLEANKQSDTVSRFVDEWAVKIRECDSLLQTVEQASLRLRKALVKLNCKKKDLESAIEKQEYNLRTLKSEAKQLERLYWRCK